MEKIKYKPKKVNSFPASTFWLMVFLFAFMVILLVLYFESRPYYSEPFTKEKIIFENMTSLNQAIAFDIINRLKPQYKNTIKELYITEDKNKIRKEYLGHNSEGHIQVLYVTALQFTNTLCHEINHNIILNENFVDDITSYYNCYS